MKNKTMICLAGVLLFLSLNTVAQKTAPILPGESGEIEVKYDTKRVNPIRKTITVTSNAKRPTVALKIKGTVIDSGTASIIENKDKSILEQ